MNKEVLPIQVLGVVPTPKACAVFLGNGEKAFTIHVELSVGQAIAMFMQGTQKERPLTHDMIGLILKGLGVSVERVLISDLKKGTYFARLILKQANELGKKIVEIDARPSDCLALAVQAKAPIFVAKEVIDSVEDMSEVLKKLNEMQVDPSESVQDASKIELDIDEPGEDEISDEDQDEDKPPPDKK